MTAGPLLERLICAVPNTAQQLAWIDDIVAFGVRRPGSATGAAVTRWCADQLGSMGYAVELQPVRCLTSHPGPARLDAWLVNDPSDRCSLDGFTAPFSTAVSARRFRLQPSDAPTTSGDAALTHVPLVELPVALLDGARLGVFDPLDEFATHTHVLPFGSRLGKEIDDVVAAGAGAMIGVFDAPWESAYYFVPYDGVLRPIPALWLDRSSGEVLDGLLARGAVDIEMTTEVVNEERVDHNVIATVAGGDAERWIVVGSHHDAPWASAVEDASGVAQVLAQAAAWATIDPADRLASMAFLLTAGHMSHGAGTRCFLESWQHRAHIQFGLHLEHIAAEAVPDGRGGLRPTDRPEVRWWFVSADGELQRRLVDAVLEAVRAEDLDRSLALPPDLFGPFPPTDGGFYHLEGIPMVNLLAAPMYLFDPADRHEMVHAASLEPTARAAVRITLDAIDGWGTGASGDHRGYE
ncbi:MAG: hypothetical protein AAGA42_12530 [Actinomycetota bacterium]